MIRGVINKFNDVIGKVRRSADEFESLAVFGSGLAARHVQEQMQQYPPESDANRPPAPYWVRGVGKIDKDGRIIEPSQHYKDSWRTEKVKEGTALTNDASYAVWIAKRDKQFHVHTARNWPTIEDVVEDQGFVDLLKQFGLEVKAKIINILS